MVGCKEFPNNQDGMKLMKLINDFINEEYKYDAPMVRSAFRMAAKQELYLDGKRIDPSTFGQHLSINVVGKILTAYKEFKRSENARPKSATGFLLNAANDERITPKEAYELCVEKNRLPEPYLHFCPLDIAYPYMVENKIIEPVKDGKSYVNVTWLKQPTKFEITTRGKAVIDHFENLTRTP